jgi:hypothetical protein
MTWTPHCPDPRPHSLLPRICSNQVSVTTFKFCFIFGTDVFLFLVTGGGFLRRCLSRPVVGGAQNVHLCKTVMLEAAAVGQPSWVPLGLAPLWRWGLACPPPAAGHLLLPSPDDCRGWQEQPHPDNWELLVLPPRQCMTTGWPMWGQSAQTLSAMTVSEAQLWLDSSGGPIMASSSPHPIPPLQRCSPDGHLRLCLWGSGLRWVGSLWCHPAEYAP